MQYYSEEESNKTDETVDVSQTRENEVYDEGEDFDKLPVLNYSEIRVLERECRKLMFEENLCMLDKEGKQIDRVTVAVEEGDQPYTFTVFQYSQDESRMLRVQSQVHLNLKTVTELRRISQLEQKRMLRISDNISHYDVFSLCVEGRQGRRNKLHIPKTVGGFLFLEGSNIVLLRKLAISGLKGQMKGQTVNHEGGLCDCEYEARVGVQGEVYVRRTVTDSDNREVMMTVLSKKGRILSHQWSNSEWYLVTSNQSERLALQLPVPSVQSERLTPEEPTPPPKADVDAYFEKKAELLQEMKEYFEYHCDVQDMIADFMQRLLIEKPEDVIDFADSFFSEFVGIDQLKNKSETGSNVSSRFSSRTNVTSQETGVQEIPTDDTESVCTLISETNSNIEQFVLEEILNKIINSID